MNAVTDTITTIHDLDLGQCIVGPDLIARFADGQVTLYRRDGDILELLGVFDGPGEAFEVLDVLDAGTAARQRYADPVRSLASSAFARMSDGTLTVSPELQSELC